MEVSKETDHNIARFIGRYYFEKQNGRRTVEFQKNAAIMEIESMRIRSIHFDGCDIVISLGGFLRMAGFDGKGVRVLERELRKEFEFKLLKVVDDYLERYLFSFKNDL
jgi:hypothetical protein